MREAIAREFDHDDDAGKDGARSVTASPGSFSRLHSCEQIGNDVLAPSMIGDEGFSKRAAVAASDRRADALAFGLDIVEQLFFQPPIRFHSLDQGAERELVLDIAGRCRELEEDRILAFEDIRIRPLVLFDRQ